MRVSNEALNDFNNFAAQKYNELASDFHKHTAMIKDMRRDLDWIFRKIRYRGGAACPCVLTQTVV